jgi:hypothetical protein
MITPKNLGIPSPDIVVDKTTATLYFHEQAFADQSLAVPPSESQNAMNCQKNHRLSVQLGNCDHRGRETRVYLTQIERLAAYSKLTFVLIVFSNLRMVEQT